MEGKEQIEELKGKIIQLQKKIEILRQQNQRLSRFQTRVAGFAVGVAARILLGPRLVASLQAWLRAKSLEDQLPVHETADLGAAILRRVIRIGFYTIALATLPAGLLIWQNLLLHNQNKSIPIQIEQQQADTFFARRAQYLDAIYAVECGNKEGHGDCRPRAHGRARREAIHAFVKI